MPNNLGSSDRPLRVALIGSGPSAFYAADSLLKSGKFITIDMFEKLPTPFGLVRYGVAPDHQKIKNVTKVYEKIAEDKNFTFFGNVTIGKDINLHQLRKFYDAVIFATGAETDRRLGIDGEDLRGSHTATEFVAWYNGHPDFSNRTFDLSCERAVVIGHGNVALDVCRILSKTVDELKTTDIAQHALDALAQSKIKEIYVLGRRGPVQASFTSSELREFAELHDCVPVVDPGQLELKYASQAELEDPHNAIRKKNYDILKSFLDIEAGSKKKKIFIKFLTSPAAIGGKVRVEKIFLEKNELIGEPGQQRSRGTGEKVTLPCGIIFRSVGYRGVPVKGLPFHDQAGVIPNLHGRVADSEHIFPGLYTVGWIKRGPSGIIGTNKPDSEETVKNLLEDIPVLNPCKNPSTDLMIDLLKKQNVRYITFKDWKKIDTVEIERGQKVGKPREKFTSVEEMLKVVGK